MAGDRKPRGELGELSAQLQGLCTKGKRTDKELVAAKREVFKKVINYMTLGMDMSALFPMMISCANLSADDVVLKKQLYLYITHYASSTPDLGLLTINQLQKDCRDQDPTVRGLALRSLCSLSIPNLLEYVVSPVTVGLSDKHPYVRRTAVMGVLKIWHMSPDTVSHTGMVEQVRSMLYQDPDPQVVANCLQMVSQLEPVSKLAGDKQFVYHLINRIKDFSEWAQCAVLELASHYRPASEAEVFDILNALEDRLGATNSAVVMAAVKLFLHATLDMAATHQQVLERIKDPLKTLIARDEPATAYAVLCHARLLVARAPILFEGDYQAFFCRSHDPWYVKKIKMEILTLMASSTNAYDIVGELTEYARDVSPPIGREAVKAIGRVALGVPDAAGVVERLLLFLEGGSDHLVAESLVQLKDLLRRYPDLGEVFSVGDIRPNQVEEPEARAALVWILGQFGAHIPGAPYLLQPLVESFPTEPPCVRLALLTAAAKLFFRRPPEARKLLGSCLAAGLSDQDQDVHDRALLYYRLLRHDVAAAEAVICPPGEAIHQFAEEQTPEAQEQIFQEFNSLSVVYQQPAALFVERAQYHSVPDADDDPDGAGGAGGGAAAAAAAGVDPATGLLEADLLSLDEGPSGGGAAGSGGGAGGSGGGGGGAAAQLAGSLLDLELDYSPAPPAGAAAAAQQQQQTAAAAGSGGGGPAGGLDDLLGGFGGGGGGGLSLAAAARVAPASFQEKWKRLPPAHSYTETLSSATVSALAANAHNDFCAHVAQGNIHTMACGGQPPAYKYYFYGQDAGSGALVLVEMVVATGPRQASFTLKSEDPALLAPFLEIWTSCLAGFYR
ncbi:beta-adaptin A [Raphidocelis subcapitata]|uniref:Beta-adaptin A n=1 Tax=Raphidocelis subcapitata TaxID=307507 RepID=A0A2V0NSG1_9CHLO|nr:beta-adaptin A [Raphidocelis subcapitata]|eukprot:GBF87867.1 beta-adaptin A [Raphidocelis subcapitata]